MAIAQGFEQLAQGKIKPHKVRETWAELCRKVYGQSTPTKTVRDYAKTWLDQKKPEAADSTYKAYETVIVRLLEFLKERADHDCADITKEDLVSFRNHLAGKLGPTRVNFHVTTLRMFFRSAHRDGYLFENPAVYLEAVRDRTERIRQPLTIKEIRAVLSVADPEWKSLIRLGLYTGQRLMDLALLTWANVDLERNEIRLTTKKTAKRLTIPIIGHLREYLLSMSDSDDLAAPLHPRAFRAVQKDGRSASLSNEFVALLAQAGFREVQARKSRGIGRDARRRASKLSFHSLRHSTVTMLKEAGIPQATVQELIGHDSEQMNALYTHVGRPQLEKAAAALPEI